MNDYYSYLQDKGWKYETLDVCEFVVWAEGESIRYVDY